MIKITKERIINSPINISLIVFATCTIAIILLVIFTVDGGYNKDFYENILVEAHGMLFDILVIGILIYWMNRMGDRQREIERLQKELKYFQEYFNPEATFHVSKTISLLKELGVKELKLVRLYLENASMLGWEFEKTLFMGCQLSQAFFDNGRFQKCDFIRSDCSLTIFSEAEISNSQFVTCSLNNADFKDASLFNVIFKSSIFTQTDFSFATLSKCSFEESSFIGTNFTEALLENCDLTGINLEHEIEWNNTTIKNCKITHSQYESKAFNNAKVINPILV